MKCKTILSISVVVLLFAVYKPANGSALPIGTAFTYQGRLIDANKAADGLYDFKFKLFDANSSGNKLGADVNKSDVNAIDGYFTVELDFGNAFDGNERWLDISVRPGYQNDPNIYTALIPRQKITATPYALYAKTAGGTGSGSVLPLGVIVMWSGSIANIPAGWVLCDGTNGTPDLRDRFIVGAGSSYSVSDTGGEAFHKLTIAEMPAHTHPISCVQNIRGGGSDGQPRADGSPTQNTGSTGGDQPHENRPPYYALAYIMKL